jgi:tRNA (cmo5U34)-methyltransferase
MAKDTIFQDQHTAEDFQFTPKVAEVFDDMLDRSVPCYRQLIGMAGRLLKQFLKDGDLIYDLGCSTGTTMLELCRRLSPIDVQFIGIDSSPAMLSKASVKAEMYSKNDRLRFIEGDILQTELHPAGAVLINYTLQFIRPIERQNLLDKIYQALRPGGVLIVSEKVISSDPLLNRTYINLYLEFKRNQGYSEIEIAKKREALENVLVPFTGEENMRMIRKAAFATVEPFFQWFNFISYIAIK